MHAQRLQQAPVGAVHQLHDEPRHAIGVQQKIAHLAGCQNHRQASRRSSRLMVPGLRRVSLTMARMLQPCWRCEASLIHFSLQVRMLTSSAYITRGAGISLHF